MWQFRILGDLIAERPARAAVSLPPRKYTALLAVFLLYPSRRWGREELTALFWPDSDNEAGRGALRSALSALRKDFGADFFDAAGSAETLRLRDGAATTDAAEFESLLRQAGQQRAVPAREAALIDAALALYHGPLLPGLYHDLIIPARERLESLAAQAHVQREALRQKATLASEQDHARQSDSPRSKMENPRLLRLPLYSGLFIGREAEQEQLERLLCDAHPRRPRLLTLTGPGGIGKTRLAVETAQTIARYFPGAVCFVPLASLQTGDEIGSVVSAALQEDFINNIPANDSAGNAARSQMLVFLRDLGPSLLILDNAEQMVERGAGQAARALLAAAPELTLLVTSRRLLGVEGEREFPLAPLGTQACQELFREHARAARPDFDQDTGGENSDGNSGNGDTLPRICERLEGIPLAIELCAPWVRVLSQTQILEHLSQRFRLLQSRRQDAPARHRSLHAALEWCCPTDPALLRFFAALSVFREGWTLEAAETVGGPDALEHLAGLREQSLVLAQAQENSLALRYRFLETIREFADEKLPADARHNARRKHLDYFERLARDQTPRLLQADAAALVFAGLDRDAANFRAAIEWGLRDTPESLQKSLRLQNEMRWCWGIRGYSVPYAAWKAQAWARRDELPPAGRARVTLEYADQCTENEKESLLREALALYQTLASGEDEGGHAHTHESLAILYRDRGQVEAMETAFRTAAALREAAGDRRGYGYTLATYAGSLSILGRDAEARALWTVCRAISEELGDQGSLAVLDRAEAGALIHEGKVAAAIPLLQAALAAFRHKGELWHLMDTLGHLSRAFLALDQPENALPLLYEAETLARGRGDEATAAYFRSLCPAADTTD